MPIYTTFKVQRARSVTVALSKSAKKKHTSPANAIAFVASHLVVSFAQRAACNKANPISVQTSVVPVPFELVEAAEVVFKAGPHAICPA